MISLSALCNFFPALLISLITLNGFPFFSIKAIACPRFFLALTVNSLTFCLNLCSLLVDTFPY